MPWAMNVVPDKAIKLKDLKIFHVFKNSIHKSSETTLACFLSSRKSSETVGIEAFDWLWEHLASHGLWKSSQGISQARWKCREIHERMGLLWYGKGELPICIFIFHVHSRLSFFERTVSDRSQLKTVEDSGQSTLKSRESLFFERIYKLQSMTIDW